MTKLERQPNLNTIKMIEKNAEEHSGEFTLTELWNSLPKRCMYQTYKSAINYLQKSCKIALDCDGKIVWIFNPEILEQTKNWPKI